MYIYVFVISLILTLSWSCSSGYVRSSDFYPGQEAGKSDKDGKTIKSDKLKHLPKAKWDSTNKLWVPAEKEGHKIIPEKKDRSKDKTITKKADPKDEAKKKPKDESSTKKRKSSDQGDRVIQADKLKTLHQGRWDQSKRIWVKVNKGDEKLLDRQKDKPKDKTATKKADPKDEAKKEPKDESSTKKKKSSDQGDRVIQADKLKTLHQGRWDQSKRIWVKVNKGDNIRIKEDKPIKKAKSSPSQKSKEKDDKSTKKN